MNIPLSSDKLKTLSTIDLNKPPKDPDDSDEEEDEDTTPCTSAAVLTKLGRALKDFCDVDAVDETGAINITKIYFEKINNREV